MVTTIKTMQRSWLLHDTTITLRKNNNVEILLLKMKIMVTVRKMVMTMITKRRKAMPQ